jgi:hypothetical protein
MNKLLIKNPPLAKTASHLIAPYIESSGKNIKVLGIIHSAYRKLLIKHYDDYYCGHKAQHEAS